VTHLTAITALDSQNDGACYLGAIKALHIMTVVISSGLSRIVAYLALVGGAIGRHFVVRTLLKLE